MFKVTIVEFVRHNAWGTTDWATHYYVGGRRVSKDTYYRGFCSCTDMRARGYEYDHTDCRTEVKNGITRNYTEMYYKKAA